jgi:hypothetical protein
VSIALISCRALSSGVIGRNAFRKPRITAAPAQSIPATSGRSWPGTGQPLPTCRYSSVIRASSFPMVRSIAYLNSANDIQCVRSTESAGRSLCGLLFQIQRKSPNSGKSKSAGALRSNPRKHLAIGPAFHPGGLVNLRRPINPSGRSEKAVQGWLIDLIPSGLPKRFIIRDIRANQRNPRSIPSLPSPDFSCGRSSCRGKDFRLRPKFFQKIVA